MFHVNFRIALFTSLVALFLLGPTPGKSQQLGKDIQEKLDSIVTATYQTATTGFPCKVKTGGKSHMIRWQDTDKCLNDAVNSVDWEALSAQLEPLRAASAGHSPADFTAAVSAAFAAHALTYAKVFAVKREDAHLPLTNSVLRYLPADSLEDIPVIDKTGKQVGTFAGTYLSERTGGLATANTYRLALFQYKDPNGNMQSPNEKLLLDSFGVPWSAVKNQPGFCLTTEKLPQPR